MMPFPTTWYSPLIVALSLAFVAAPILVLGLGIQARLFPYLGLARRYLLGASIASVCLIGYGVFWLSLASPMAGQIASIACWCAALALAVHGPSRKRLAEILADPDVRWPLILLMTASFVALELDLALLPDPLPDSWHWGGPTRLRFEMYVDDTLPFVLAKRLFSGWDITVGILATDTLERAPLQAGLVLIELPVWEALGSLPFVNASWMPHLYRPYGTLLQSTWIAAGFTILRGLGLSVRGSVGVLASLLPSYFFFMNSVYVWPKLLAGGLVVSVYGVLIQRDGMMRRPGGRHLLYGATLAGLGILAHPGVALSLLVFGLMLLAPGRRPRWRHVVLAGCMVAGLVGPWLALQHRLLDNPGFLMRTHFANVERGDPRDTLEALRDTYADFTPGPLIAHKLEQVSMIVGTSDEASGYKLPSAGRFELLRAYHRNSLGVSLGILNLGWLVVIGSWLRGRGDPRSRLHKCGECLIAGLLCTALWLGLQLSIAVVYHGSYAAFILLFIGLAASLTCLPRGLGISILALHAWASLALALLGWGPSIELAPAHLSAAVIAASVLMLSLLSQRGPSADSLGR